MAEILGETGISTEVPVCTITGDDETIQPWASVAVTEYEPGVETELLIPTSPSDHVYALKPELALRIAGSLQIVIGPAGEIESAAGVVSKNTKGFDAAGHPSMSVPTTEIVEAELTTITAVPAC